MTVKKPNTKRLTRYDAYAARVKLTRQGLLKDIDFWLQQPDNTEAIHHHVGQFQLFCRRVFAQLDEDFGRSEEEITFRLQVIGILTTQWLLLRNVATLRLAGSPYREALNKLDRQAARYYNAVQMALPKKLEKRLTDSTPLVFLGSTSQLTLFNDESKMPPAIISIPFGSISNTSPLDRGRLSLAHEVGHAIFYRLQPVLRGICTKLRALTLNSKLPLTQQQRLIRKVVIGWVAEIAADLVGLALGGPLFADSAFGINAGPEAILGLTDKTHPVPIIRPYIYLEFFSYVQQADYRINEEPLPTYINSLGELAQKIEAFSGKYLTHRFESMPALTKVSLDEVRAEMAVITQTMLNNNFGIIDHTFGQVLIDSAINMRKAADEPLDQQEIGLSDWGKELQIHKPFVLDLSNLLAPTYAVPVSIGDEVYCSMVEICDSQNNGQSSDD